MSTGITVLDGMAGKSIENYEKRKYGYVLCCVVSHRDCDASYMRDYRHFWPLISNFLKIERSECMVSCRGFIQYSNYKYWFKRSSNLQSRVISYSPHVSINLFPRVFFSFKLDIKQGNEFSNLTHNVQITLVRLCWKNKNQKYQFLSNFSDLID